MIQELECYRIIHELISNVLKHAKAKSINIQLNKINAELNLMVEDDGQGFSIQNMAYKGMGLRNVEERVERLEGHLNIDSGKGSGTTVIVNIPLPSSKLTSV